MGAATEQSKAAEKIAAVTLNGASVQAALAAVMFELPGIGRDSNAPGAMGGYAFRGIEAVTREVQPLLAKHGVVIAPRAEITDVRAAVGMKDGWQDTYLRVEWLITGPDGSTITAQTCGIGRDNSDKGSNKAQTQAFKYLLLHLLCISDSKDDSDGVGYDHGRAPERVLAPDAKHDAIRLGLEHLTEAGAAWLGAWWKSNGIPPLKRGLTDGEADLVLSVLMTADDKAAEAAPDMGIDYPESGDS